MQALAKLIIRTGDVRCVEPLGIPDAAQRILEQDIAVIRAALVSVRLQAVDERRVERVRAAIAALPAPREAKGLDSAESRIEDDEARLLSRVCATPDDDEPRLVYGDFPSERADPRGEFIALQFKATLTPIEQKRMRALLRDHGSGWLGAIGPAVQKPGRAFARGFLSQARVEFKTPAQRRMLLDHPLWNTLEVLSGWPVRSDDFLVGCPLLGLRRLRHFPG